MHLFLSRLETDVGDFADQRYILLSSAKSELDIDLNRMGHVIEADLPKARWREYKERQYRIIFTIGQQKINSKDSEKSKRPKWDETYPL